MGCFVCVFGIYSVFLICTVHSTFNLGTESAMLLLNDKFESKVSIKSLLYCQGRLYSFGFCIGYVKIVSVNKSICNSVCVCVCLYACIGD